MERGIVTAGVINQLFGSSDPSPLALIRKRRWWLQGEEHSGLFVDLRHAQHINWGLYKAPSIDCFFPGKTAAGYPPLATLQISLFAGGSSVAVCCCASFFFSAEGAARGATTAHRFRRADRQKRYRDNLLS